MRSFFTALRRFRRENDGTSTIEFCLLFPIFIFVFITGFEAGLYMTRTVMLERATDIAIRDIRLGGANTPDFDRLKKNICDNAGRLIPDCEDNLMVRLDAVPAGADGVKTLDKTARCINKSAKIAPIKQTTYNTGAQNQLMAVRVCALVRPLFPTTKLGVAMSVDSKGNSAIVALSAFVNEPT